MRAEPSTDGVRAARSIGIVECVIGVAGTAYAVLSPQPTTAAAAFRWLLLASCLGFLAVGIILLVLAGSRRRPAVDGMPSWIRPAAIGGGVLLCLGLLGLLSSLAFHPGLWVVVAAVAALMLSMQVFGLTAGAYRLHGGKRVG